MIWDDDPTSRRAVVPVPWVQYPSLGGGCSALYISYGYTDANPRLKYFIIYKNIDYFEISYLIAYYCEAGTSRIVGLKDSDAEDVKKDHKPSNTLTA